MMTTHFPPQSLSDLVVKYDDHCFHVHKTTLHSQSKWFATTIDALEKNENEIVLPTIRGHDHIAMNVVFVCMYYPRITSWIPFLSRDIVEVGIQCDQQEMQKFRHFDMEEVLKASSEHKLVVFCPMIQIMVYLGCDSLLEYCENIAIKCSTDKSCTLATNAFMCLLLVAQEGNFKKAEDVIIPRIARGRKDEIRHYKEPICARISRENYKRLFEAAMDRTS